MTTILASALTGLFALAAALGTLFLQQRHQRAMVREERLWSRRAETYVDLLQYQGGSMLEGYQGGATAREWAIRDEMTARAAAFASDVVRERWQRSAQASLDLVEFVDAMWPELSGTDDPAERAEIEAAMEDSPDFRRFRQTRAEAAEQLARQIRAELGSAREGSARSFKQSTEDD